MERAVEITDVDRFEDEPERVAIPRPRENGSYTIESLGRWVDRLMGSERSRARAAAQLEPYYEKVEDAESDPELVEVPPAWPGATGAIKKGAGPDAERR